MWTFMCETSHVCKRFMCEPLISTCNQWRQVSLTLGSHWLEIPCNSAVFDSAVFSDGAVIYALHACHRPFDARQGLFIKGHDSASILGFHPFKACQGCSDLVSFVKKAGPGKTVVAMFFCWHSCRFILQLSSFQNFQATVFWSVCRSSLVFV